MWVVVRSWMIADDEPPPPKEGGVLPSAGLVLWDAVVRRADDVGDPAGLTEATPWPDEPRCEVTGVLVSQGPILAGEGAIARLVGTELRVEAGGLVVVVEHRGPDLDVDLRPGDRVRAAGRLGMRAHHEWDADDTATCADWRVEGVRSTPDGHTLVDVDPVPLLVVDPPLTLTGRATATGSPWGRRRSRPRAR